ncbi:MAG: AAA family ATPase [Synergistetes bacterium]|nr:AAA family ATPase [Synergistota bacterium]MCX8127856.1 AAA family ATPase [Synergistota bacterium]MDW8192118.1 ATP-binding protein [Synergistota bacterium]
MSSLELSYEELRVKCPLNVFDFRTTEDIEPLSKGIIGQDRVAKAAHFGLRVKSPGYNLFFVGITGTGRTTYAKKIAQEIALTEPVPSDWCYVYNFKNPSRPIALSFPAGKGREFKKDIEELLDELKARIPKAFEGEEFEARKRLVFKELQEQVNELMEALNREAELLGFALKRTPTGFINVPLVDGREMTQEEFNALPLEKKKELEARSLELHERTMQIMREVQRLEKGARERIKRLEKELCIFVIGGLFKDLKEKYVDLPKVVAFLEDMMEDVVEHLHDFLITAEEGEPHKKAPPSFDKYRVNLLVDNSRLEGAPVVFESNPTYYNLVGKLEYEQRMGFLVTDFTKIKAGAIHRANGGYLILNVIDVLRNFGSWDALKRVLKTGEIRVENIAEHVGLIPVSGLVPEPIPVKVKVLLIGSPWIYHLLSLFDEDFKKLFKIKVDFDVEMERNENNIKEVCRFISSYCREEGLLHCDKTALAALIDYSSELAEDQRKLSTRFSDIITVLIEADAWARMDGSNYIEDKHVKKAIEEKIYRENRYEEKLKEMFARDQIIIEAEGEKVGQINGLAILNVGDYSFGKPSRITATVHLGQRGVINIERESRMSGKIHDKGVMILSNYMASRYAKDFPLTLSASICFEQLYEGIEGDSASAAELYALLSAISGIPLRQDIAITGSVDQKGNIQPIGGVNKKIAGFFDFCRIKGLTGRQGVIIPYRNKENLMLREDIVEAVKEGKFHIYAIRTIDEGIEILTGLNPQRFHEEVEKKLREMAETLREWGRKKVEKEEKREEEEKDEGERNKGIIL